MTLTSPLGENGLCFKFDMTTKIYFTGTKTWITQYRLFRITSTETPKGAVQVNQTLGDCRAYTQCDSLLMIHCQKHTLFFVCII